MSTSSNQWGWGNASQASSNSTQQSVFGSLGIKVNSNPSYLSMDPNSGTIEFNSDCPHIEDAVLQFDNQSIGIFSGGICEVHTDCLQALARDRDLLEIDFTLRHNKIDWPLCQFSIDVDWGEAIRAEAVLYDDLYDEKLECKIRTIVPGIYTHNEDFEVIHTLLNSKQKEIGDAYTKSMTLHRMREYDISSRRFNLSDFRRVCGVRIQILEREKWVGDEVVENSGDVVFEKIKLLRKQRRTVSADPIDPIYWIGEKEVSYSYEELRQTGDDGYEWSDKSKIMPRDIRELWSDKLRPPSIVGIDEQSVTTEVDGDSYRVSVPLKLDFDFQLVQDSKIIRLRIQEDGWDGVAKDIELNYSPQTDQVIATFLLDTVSGMCKLSVTVLTEFANSNSEDFCIQLQKLIEIIDSPYTEDDVLYFARGELAQDSISLRRCRFSDKGDPALAWKRDEDGNIEYVEIPLWCPECNNLLSGLGKCGNSRCQASQFEDIGRLIPEDIEVKDSSTGSKFEYGISIDRLDSGACSSFYEHIVEKEKFLIRSSPSEKHKIEKKAEELRGFL